MRDPSAVVIGAGPYGLSIAAHLKRRGLLKAIFGRPMDFWERMPRGMLLKSPWSASSMADPRHRYTLDRYIRWSGGERVEPIPLPMFVEYGKWFRNRAVGDVDGAVVQRLQRSGDRFCLRISDGREVEARRVVVATGLTGFPYVPAFAHGLPEQLCSHTLSLQQPSAFAGRSVAVIGAGQSALESAALLSEAGAAVEVIARGPVRWASRRLYDQTGPFRRVFYPPSDVGPVGINWLVAFPRFDRHLPNDLRWRLRDRAVRPSGAKWLRGRVDGVVKITEWSSPVRAESQTNQLMLTLSDGSRRSVDHLMLGTGFRPNTAGLPFIDPALVAAIANDGRGHPVLDAWFQSSVPGLYFAGALATGSFGALCGFVAGTATAASQVAAHVARAV